LADQRVRAGLEALKQTGSITSKTLETIHQALDGKLSIGEATPPDSGVHAMPEGCLDLVFFVGFGVEPWNPSTMKESGIGGSETAVAEMGRRFAAMGHRVRVYGDCEKLEGIFDGVQYLHHSKFKDVECDILITSRRPHVTDDEFGVKARATICWVHDVSLGSSLTQMRALRIDRFLTLSQWHRDFFANQYPFIHSDQIMVTRNGINLSRFDQDSGPRNPHKAVYSSSPDRGLDVAIRAWPKVREKVPDAELHVFYGFHTWEVSAQSVNDQGQIQLIQHLKDQLKKFEDYGVKHRGRIDQDSLAHEFLTAGVWAYPTWFSETSCITAMEAQAAGLRIVTSPIAALNETVGDRGVMISGDWLSEGYMTQWVDAVVDAMIRPGDEDRILLQDYARNNFGWDTLAEDWNRMFKDIVEEVERNIVPPYQAAV
jgi:glycosyltransferase involved in cell wall biosynthesis